MAEKTPEEKAREDAARRDAEESARWDKMFGTMDAMCSRMDAFETKEKEREDKSRKDAEEAEEKAKADAARKDEEDKEKEEKEKADKARKDAEEAEEKKKMEDAARADASSATLAEIKAQLETFRTHLSAQPADMASYGEAQARADAVFRLNGKQAPPPMVGEKLLDYRRRLLGTLQPSSKEWGKTDLKSLADGDVFDNIERHIFADAESAARDSSTIPGGTMRKIEKRDATGRTITEWHGSWMASQPVPPISLRRVNPALRGAA